MTLGTRASEGGLGLREKDLARGGAQNDIEMT